MDQEILCVSVCLLFELNINMFRSMTAACQLNTCDDYKGSVCLEIFSMCACVCVFLALFGTLYE